MASVANATIVLNLSVLMSSPPLDKVRIRTNFQRAVFQSFVKDVAGIIIFVS